MSLTIRQANYFCEAKILLSSAVAGLLKEYYNMTFLLHDCVKSTVLKYVLFLPISFVKLCRICGAYGGGKRCAQGSGGET
jgi:hypothetical protein